MTEEERIRRSLEELKRLTGLTLMLSPEDEADEDAEEKLAMITAAYREKYDRTNFLRNLLYGNIQEADLYAAASRFHIPENGRRAVLVIECGDGNAESAAQVTRQLFVDGKGSLQAVLDERRLVLVRTLRQREGEEQILSLAHTAVDTLNSEAMIKVRVGFSREIRTLKEMPKAFREAVTALRIGSIFYSSETVLDYSRLGIGRLVYDLPVESGKMFLRELFGGGSPDDFDDETKEIINAFFENNLNISETARQLFVHRNTLVYRLEKLHQATGLDLRIFDDAIAMKIAMMISSSLRADERKGEKYR